MFYAILAVLPVCLLLIWLYTRDRLHPEPKRRVWSLFLRGAGVVLPAGLLERVLMESHGIGVANSLMLPSVFVTAFFVAGMVEEFLKAAVVDRGALQRGYIHTPLDSIIYSGATALGFACVENILYVTHDGISTAVLRAVTAVPAHLMFGIWMGYYFAQSVFRGKSKAWAYIVPAVAHGLYDTFALSNGWWSDGLLFVYLLILLEQSLRRIDRAERLSVEVHQRVS
ncbi:PrsW family intramembrane metalloprotease [Alicyclobacillus curvatus]|jgi:protease PrsW|nr:PrsW family intramembrane metalloprotease [Alicyclobacillus curvatus]